MTPRQTYWTVVAVVSAIDLVLVALACAVVGVDFGSSEMLVLIAVMWGWGVWCAASRQSLRVLRKTAATGENQ